MWCSVVCVGDGGDGVAVLSIWVGGRDGGVVFVVPVVCGHAVVCVVTVVCVVFVEFVFWCLVLVLLLLPSLLSLCCLLVAVLAVMFAGLAVVFPLFFLFGLVILLCGFPLLAVLLRAALVFVIGLC